MTEGLKALIIDDESAVAKFFYDAFVAKGVEAHIAPTTRQGIERLAQDNYDMVLTDLSQDPTGVEVYRLAKSKGIIYVRIVTGGGDDKLLEEAKTVAGNDLLMKPLNIKTIFELIEQAKREKT